jgi:hypothetical protein
LFGIFSNPKHLKKKKEWGSKVEWVRLWYELIKIGFWFWGAGPFGIGY